MQWYIGIAEHPPCFWYNMSLVCLSAHTNRGACADLSKSLWILSINYFNLPTQHQDWTISELVQTDKLFPNIINVFSEIIWTISADEQVYTPHFKNVFVCLVIKMIFCFRSFVYSYWIKKMTFHLLDFKYILCLFTLRSYLNI